jgi:hypothetical protein
MVEELQSVMVAVEELHPVMVAVEAEAEVEVMVKLDWPDRNSRVEILGTLWIVPNNTQPNNASVQWLHCLPKFRE